MRNVVPLQLSREEALAEVAVPRFLLQRTRH